MALEDKEYRRTYTLGALGPAMVMEVGSLDAGGLRTLLSERAAQCLLLDCRSFFAFNAGHIAGSVNVRFSTIVRRRAKGAMGLEHIVPNAELRGRLLAGAYHAVVLLDERSAALDAAKRDGTLALAAGALCREARAAQVFFLQGTRALGDARGGLHAPCRLGAGLVARGSCPTWSRGVARVVFWGLAAHSRALFGSRNKDSRGHLPVLGGGGVVRRCPVPAVLMEKQCLCVLRRIRSVFSFLPRAVQQTVDPHGAQPSPEY